MREFTSEFFVDLMSSAGSRHETHESLGAAHVIRVAAGLSTSNATQFAIIRNVQDVGANLTVTSDRELISYTLEGTRDAVQQTLPFLTEVATKQVFKPWELSDNIYRLKLELATRPPQVRGIFDQIILKVYVTIEKLCSMIMIHLCTVELHANQPV